MFTNTVRRTLLIALVLTLCLLPAAAQAGRLQLTRDEARTVASRVQEGEGIFMILWKRVVGFLEKNGASIDPSGGTGDSGASIDPTGGTTDNGASIDPNGAPSPSGNGG